MPAEDRTIRVLGVLADVTNYHYCRAGKLAAVVTVPHKASLEFAHINLFTIPDTK